MTEKKLLVFKPRSLGVSTISHVEKMKSMMKFYDEVQFNKEDADAMLKMFEDAKPKRINKNITAPIILGTKGELE